MRVPDPPGFHHNAHEGTRLVRSAIAQQIIHRESIVCQTISDRPPMVHTSPIATIVRNDTRHNPSSWQRRSAIDFIHIMLMTTMAMMMMSMTIVSATMVIRHRPQARATLNPMCAAQCIKSSTC